MSLGVRTQGALLPQLHRAGVISLVHRLWKERPTYTIRGNCVAGGWSQMRRGVQIVLACSVLTLALSVVQPGGARADDKQDELLKRLDKLEAEVTRLKQELKKTRAASASSQPSAKAPQNAAKSSAGQDIVVPPTPTATGSAAIYTLSEPRVKGAFDGFYVLASAGLQNGFNTNESSGNYSYLASPYYDSSKFSYARLRGFDLGLTAGFNATSGNLLVGFEVSGR